MRHWIQRCWVVVTLLIALPVHADWYYEVDKQSAWQGNLNARMAAIEEVFGGKLGVYVQNLTSGEAYSWQADEPWYLASLVKVPVAAQVLAEHQAGTLSLDERITLTSSDFVDGAGPVNWHDPGTPISIRYLLEQMITISDNTASDMLIDRVGLDAVNARAKAMVSASGGQPDDIGLISKLVGVRQGVYGQLHPNAYALVGTDFMALRQYAVSQRASALARTLGVSRDSLAQPDYDHAFDAYQMTGENIASLRSYGDLLASLHHGGMADLDAEQRQALLSLMARTRSGERRLKQGLGSAISFAHKTGTQHRRSCDAGIATRNANMSGAGISAENGPWVIVSCSRGPIALNAHERALASVGQALRYSGAIGMP